MEKFKKGDKVRALKDVKREGKQHTEHLCGDIMEVVGAGDENCGQVIWFKHDGGGYFESKDFELVGKENKESIPKPFKGKWCINITEENVSYLKKHFKCGAGYHIKQTLFFNEEGSLGGGNPDIGWNMDYNNICRGEKYKEISFKEFRNMVEGEEESSKEPNYEIY